MYKQSTVITVTFLILSQQLGLVKGRYKTYIRGGATSLSPELSTLDDSSLGSISLLSSKSLEPQHQRYREEDEEIHRRWMQQQEDTKAKRIELELESSFPSRVDRTYVFPRSLNPDCAAGRNAVLGVTHFHFEAIDRMYENTTFVNSIHWLFRSLKEAGELPLGAEMTSPRVIHDSLNERFLLVSTMTDKESYSKLYLAISKDSYPRTGNEHDWDLLVLDVWDYAADRITMLWANELALSVDDQAIYITSTMYKTILRDDNEDYVEMDEFVESRVWILKKRALLTTVSNLRVSSQAIDATLLGLEGGLIANVIPLDIDGVRLGPYVPATIPYPSQKTSTTFGTYLVAINDQYAADEEEYLHIIRMGDVLSTSSTIMASYVVSLGDIERSEEALPNAKQPDPTYQPIETGDRRVSDAVWQSDALYIATTLRLGEDRTAVFWAKIQADSAFKAPSTLAIQIHQDRAQLGIIPIAGPSGSEDTTSTFYPSIAVSPYGDLMVGFAASGDNIYSGMYASVVTSEVSTSIEIKAGEDNYESIDGRAFHGQYSGMAADPVDIDCFWALNAFARINDPTVWNTWEGGALAVQWGKVCTK